MTIAIALIRFVPLQRYIVAHYAVILRSSSVKL